MSGAAKIKSYEPDAFPVELPWDLASNADLRVYSTDEDGVDTPLELGVDFTLSGGSVELVKDVDAEFVVLACVPCVELAAPKFQPISNDVIIEAFQGLRDHNAYLEARIADYCSRPRSCDCCEDEKLMLPPPPADPPKRHCVVKYTKYDWDVRQLFGCWEKPITCWDYGEFEISPKIGKTVFDNIEFHFGKKPRRWTKDDFLLRLRFVPRPRFRRFVTISKSIGGVAKDVLAFEYYSKNFTFPTTKVCLNV